MNKENEKLLKNLIIEEGISDVLSTIGDIVVENYT